MCVEIADDEHSVMFVEEMLERDRVEGGLGRVVVGGDYDVLLVLGHSVKSNR